MGWWAGGLVGWCAEGSRGTWLDFSSGADRTAQQPQNAAANRPRSSFRRRRNRNHAWHRHTTLAARTTAMPGFNAPSATPPGHWISLRRCIGIEAAWCQWAQWAGGLQWWAGGARVAGLGWISQRRGPHCLLGKCPINHHRSSYGTGGIQETRCQPPPIAARTTAMLVQCAFGNSKATGYLAGMTGIERGAGGWAKI